MSEEHPKYQAGDAGGITPGALLPFTDPEYSPPTPADVRALKARSGKTGRELCAIVGMEDHRTWRRWSQDADAAGHRKIPYSAWRLLLLELDLV